MLWMIVASCTGGGGPKPPEAPPTAETGSTTTEPVLQDTAATAETGDTASWVLPPRLPSVRLLPEGEGDWAGRDLDLADLDGDGLPEVLVSSDWSRNSASGSVKLHPEASALYLLRAPLASGALRQQPGGTGRGRRSTSASSR